MYLDFFGSELTEIVWSGERNVYIFSMFLFITMLPDIKFIYSPLKLMVADSVGTVTACANAEFASDK